MAINVLESDKHGNVVAKPVILWATTTIKNVTVLVAIEYADSPEEAAEIRDSGFKTEGRKIQLDLTPEQSLQLARALIDTANHVLEHSSKDKYQI